MTTPTVGSVYFDPCLCLENPPPRAQGFPQLVQRAHALNTSPRWVPVPGVKHWDAWCCLAVDGKGLALLTPVLWNDLGHDRHWRRALKADYLGKGVLNLPFAVPWGNDDTAWLLLGFGHWVGYECLPHPVPWRALDVTNARAAYRHRVLGK